MLMQLLIHDQFIINNGGLSLIRVISKQQDILMWDITLANNNISNILAQPKLSKLAAGNLGNEWWRNKILSNWFI